MAYIEADDLYDRLPFDGGSLDTDDIQAYIDEHISLAQGENDTETPFSRRYVYLAAKADALEEIYEDDASIEDNPKIKDLRDRADKYLEKHDAMKTVSGEPGEIEDLYSNLTDEDLWDMDELLGVSDG